MHYIPGTPAGLSCHLTRAAPLTHSHTVCDNHSVQPFRRHMVSSLHHPWLYSTLKRMTPPPPSWQVAGSYPVVTPPTTCKIFAIRCEGWSNAKPTLRTSRGKMFVSYPYVALLGIKIPIRENSIGFPR